MAELTNGPDAGALVHDLAQPLTVLDGYLHALHKSKGLDAEAARFVEAAREASRELLEILDRFAREVVADGE